MPKLFFLPLALLLTSSAALADRSDENLEKILNAARTLNWAEYYPDARAYLLVKTRTVRAPVALVFGYVDNHEACLELARDLTNAANQRALSPGPDLYVCDGVY